MTVTQGPHRLVRKGRSSLLNTVCPSQEACFLKERLDFDVVGWA